MVVDPLLVIAANIPANQPHTVAARGQVVKTWVSVASCPVHWGCGQL